MPPQFLLLLQPMMVLVLPHIVSTYTINGSQQNMTQSSTCMQEAIMVLVCANKIFQLIIGSNVFMIGWVCKAYLLKKWWIMHWIFMRKKNLFLLKEKTCHIEFFI